MIALDSNVLIRYFAQDDAVQARLATRLIEAELSPDNPGFVSLPVICELVWVLTRAYDQQSDAVGRVIRMMLDTRQIVVENAAIVAAALEAEGAGFVDALVHELGRARGCSRTVTFDRRFARMEGVELLA